MSSRGQSTRPLVLGLFVLVLAWGGPAPHWAAHSFVAHMSMHVAVVAIAAPLLALAIHRRPDNRRLHGFFAMSPLLASALDLIVIWAWHAPLLHHASRHHTAMMALEQGSFLLVALLVWVTAFRSGSGRQHGFGGALGLLMTSTHMTLLGVLLALAPRPLYPHHGAALFGLDALEDQALGGVVMLLVAGSSYLIGALVLLRGLLRSDPLPRQQPGNEGAAPHPTQPEEP